MKAALFAVALGAFVAVRASEDTPMDERAQALFDGASNINWENFSPQSLGMRLNFDELSDAELDKVVDGFIQLGLIEESEREGFKDSLVHPAMRNMIAGVQENWGSTMNKILADPAFSIFLQRLRGGVDDLALGQIVGLDGGIGEAVKRLQDENADQMEEEDAEEEEEEEAPKTGAASKQQQPSK